MSTEYKLSEQDELRLNMLKRFVDNLKTTKVCNKLVLKRVFFTVILNTGLILSFYGYGQDSITNNEFKVKPNEKVKNPNATKL